MGKGHIPYGGGSRISSTGNMLVNRTLVLYILHSYMVFELALV